ncbi:MAG: HAD-IIIC family phosphatase [Gemmatimonadota bacterium]|nr:HAD-IIIC family phosphatase [Gemmatimonadota bacterium]
MSGISAQDAFQRRSRGLALQREGNSRGLPSVGVVVLSSFTADMLAPLLGEALERAGLHGDIQLGEFGQIEQAILDPTSVLYRVRPDVVVLIPAVEDLLVPLFARPSQFTAADAHALAQSQAASLSHSLEILLERLPTATCYVVAFGPQHAPAEYVLDPRSPQRGQAAVESLLARVRELSALSPRVVVVDWEWHTRTCTVACHDPRLWFLARMRLSPVGFATMADLIVNYVGAARGHPYKVVVLDLDNTLWGGVVGEAGPHGIELGEEGLGLAFQEFQRELLKMHDAGILLAIASKNNPDDAFEVLRGHPSMVLKQEHFAAVRINWQDKATNVRELADELNLGVDSFVFLDDNPVEREWLRRALPAVFVPDLPPDPVDRPAFLRKTPFFQRVTLTETDRIRARTYTLQARRAELRSSASSFDEFLASLAQEVTIEPLQPQSLARAAQMCQRTNQFNLTTRRYTVADLERMLHSADTEAYVLAVKDRFGDNGITGLGILKLNGDSAEVDSLLLSCRVLGRRVEDVVLRVLAERARERGVRYLVGRYIPTPKNAHVASFYPDRGFVAAGDGVFRLDLAEQRLDAPTEIVIKVHAGASVADP